MITMNKLSLLRQGFKKMFFSSSSNNFDLIMIRHAESKFNEACDQFTKQLGIDKLGWDEQMNVKAYSEEVLFNEAYFDSKLSEKGKEQVKVEIYQCRNVRETINNIPIDLVLVSPKIRTLETC